MDKARSKGKSQLRIIVGKASMKYRKVQVEESLSFLLPLFCVSLFLMSDPL